MSPETLLVLLLGLSASAYWIGLRRSEKVASGVGGIKSLHSRPAYYGALAALWCAIPALCVYAIWLTSESIVITNLVVSQLPPEIHDLPPDRLGLVINGTLAAPAIESMGG